MNTISNRLRGRYPLGPFQTNGEPEFGWRQFDIELLPELKKPSAIMLEAAVILNGDWSGTTVRLTQKQHDRLIEIQGMRNLALRGEQQ